MLSRKQLEVMSKCNENISYMNCLAHLGCNCDEEAARTALELLDKTEAQQKEIERLQKEVNKQYFAKVGYLIEKDKAIEQNETLQSEKEQLKAQNAAQQEEIRLLREQLPEGDVMEVLKQAKKAFADIIKNTLDYKIAIVSISTTEIIDKVIGGGQ